MTDFLFYFEEGWNHIVSADALDHQLFLMALMALFLLKDWKSVLILVTAFTIGHSLTLILSTLDIIRFDSDWVEFLIPCTIAFTALNNLRFLNKPRHARPQMRINYIMALVFGLIHGMGFANSIRMLLASDQNLGVALFGFNIGIEVGQVVVVFILLLLAHLLIKVMRVPQNLWIIALSGISFIWSMKMVLERIP